VTRASDDGQFEVELPEDIDKGKYKIILRASHDADEILDLYISKVRIK
jgi:hypothetical protein